MLRYSLNNFFNVFGRKISTITKRNGEYYQKSEVIQTSFSFEEPKENKVDKKPVFEEVVFGEDVDFSFEDLENYVKDEYDLERLYIIEERKIIVHRALKKLNAEYKQVLWLLYFEGLSNTEAAIVMKKNSRQMKNLVYRAKSALKSELDKEGFVYEKL